MAKKPKYLEEEKENMLDMLMNTVHSLVKEKLRDAKWNEKIKEINFKINLEIPEVGVIHFILEKEGQYEVEKGGISDPVIEIKAPLVNFYNFSSRQISSFSAIFLRKLKIKGKRHLRTLLKVGNVLRIIPEKERTK